MDDFYGPPLPPGYKNDSEDNEEITSKSTTSTSTSSKLSSTKPVIGPQCPDFLSRRSSDSEDDYPSKVMRTENYTPSTTTTTIGPVLPAELLKSSNMEDCDMPFGPIPGTCGPVEPVNDIIATIEKRAKDMRNKLDQSDVPVPDSAEREEWMIVPDTSRKNQLGAISRCLAPGSEKAESKHRKHHHHHHSDKDKKTAEELKKYNKSKRSESLLEMHKKNKKKKEKKSSSPAERKAFDRDEMAVRLFNKDQVNSVIDKAKYLNKRFSAGASHFL